MADINDWIWNEVQQIGKNYDSFDEVAYYDESHSKFRDIEKECDNILSYIGVNGTEKLLDIGCGTGAFVRHAAKHGLTCTGVDISEKMLAFAKKSTPESLKVTYAKGGFLTYQQEKDCFDIVTSSFSFHHLPDFYKYIALKNIHSLLKDEGVYFLQDIVIEEEEFESNINNLIDHQYNVGGDFLRDDVIQHFREEFSTFSWIIDGLLSRAGFALEQKEIEGGLLAWYKCRKSGPKD